MIYSQSLSTDSFGNRYYNITADPDDFHVGSVHTDDPFAVCHTTIVERVWDLVSMTNYPTGRVMYYFSTRDRKEVKDGMYSD